MKKLLLTLDYELYVDGSGDVFKHIVEPTNAILDVATRFGVLALEARVGKWK